eukprot:2117604-Amphidinium_carterae.1
MKHKKPKWDRRQPVFWDILITDILAKSRRSNPSYRDRPQSKIGAGGNGAKFSTFFVHLGEYRFVTGSAVRTM